MPDPASRAESSGQAVLVDVNLPIGAGFNADELRSAAARRLEVAARGIVSCALLTRALDARRKNAIHWQCRLHVRLEEERDVRRVLASRLALPVTLREGDLADREILEGTLRVMRESAAPRVVVVGCGPAGLFAAHLLARHGFPPLVLERGRRVEERVRDVRAFERGGALDPESNILFGEGGAGTFSDGKLTSRSKSPLVRFVYEEVVACSGPEEVLVDAKPHVGTDRLRAVLVHLRRRLERDGVTFRFEARVEDLRISPEGVSGVVLADGEEIATDTVILAIGHSARDTYEMLERRGVAMAFKPFQAGLRMEHPQDMIGRAQYGDRWRELPAADYVLTGPGPRRTFSFCMCPGGTIVASVSEPGHLCTNGMSRHRRDSRWATSGLVFTVEPGDLGSDSPHPLAGVALQRSLESRAFELARGTYRLPAQRADHFLEGRLSETAQLETSYALGVVPADLREIMVAPAIESMQAALRVFDGKIPGYAGPSGVLVGPEARGSSPVRLERDGESLQSVNVRGLYPAGEGAGYAGGIVSAAIDGLHVARAVLTTPCRR
ncbi:MAG: FAD-dependent oxidoreductase [Planctomycetota bacterium]